MQGCKGPGRLEARGRVHAREVDGKRSFSRQVPTHLLIRLRLFKQESKLLYGEQFGMVYIKSK